MFRAHYDWFCGGGHIYTGLHRYTYPWIHKTFECDGEGWSHCDGLHARTPRILSLNPYCVTRGRAGRWTDGQTDEQLDTYIDRRIYLFIFLLLTTYYEQHLVPAKWTASVPVLILFGGPMLEICTKQCSRILQQTFPTSTIFIRCSATLTFETEENAKKMIEVYKNHLDLTYVGSEVIFPHGSDTPKALDNDAIPQTSGAEIETEER